MHNVFMRLLFLVLFALVLPLHADQPATPAPVWHTSIMDARHLCEMSGKPLLVLFSGTGWDGTSDAFLKDFNSNPAAASIAKRAVLLRIDMPSSPKIPVGENAIQINNIAVFMRIDTVPTIVLCNIRYDAQYRLAITKESAASVINTLDPMLRY